MDLTLLVCNLDTPQELKKLLQSVKLTSTQLPKVVVMNTSIGKESGELLDIWKVPYYNYRGAIHGEAVNLGFRKVQTRYVLLVDSDVILYKDFLPVFEKFKETECALMGKIVGNVGQKQLYERVEPWFCFIDLDQLKKHKIEFFDRERTKASKKDKAKVYDVGSTMFEDVQKAGLTIGDADLAGKYFKHYGGMSWRTQKYNPKDVDTDIDFGGTHPHRIISDIGWQVKFEYGYETLYLEDVDIKEVFE